MALTPQQVLTVQAQLDRINNNYAAPGLTVTEYNNRESLIAPSSSVIQQALSEGFITQSQYNQLMGIATLSPADAANWWQAAHMQTPQTMSLIQQRGTQQTTPYTPTPLPRAPSSATGLPPAATPLPSSTLPSSASFSLFGFSAGDFILAGGAGVAAYFLTDRDQGKAIAAGLISLGVIFVFHKIVETATGVQSAVSSDISAASNVVRSGQQVLQAGQSDVQTLQNTGAFLLNPIAEGNAVGTALVKFFTGGK